MKTFKDFMSEGVVDIQQVKRKRLADRTSKEQAVLDAAKQNKPAQGKVEVHIKHEDGSVSKERFKLQKHQSKWEDEANEIAKGHLKNLQTMKDKYPDIGRSRAKEVHKVIIK